MFDNHDGVQSEELRLISCRNQTLNSSQEKNEKAHLRVACRPAGNSLDPENAPPMAHLVSLRVACRPAGNSLDPEKCTPDGPFGLLKRCLPAGNS